MSYTLHNGDCLEYMKTLPDKSVDCILTDFPYGVGVDYNTYEDTQENLEELINSALPHFFRLSDRVIFTCGIINVHLFPKPDWILSWAYSGGGSTCRWGFNVWQPLLVYGKDPYLTSGKGSRPDMIYRTEKAPTIKHPCPKPQGVWDAFLNRCTLEDETVLDPFMGSGTTGISCVKYERHFIGCEIDTELFFEAKERIEQASRQGHLFGAPANKVLQRDQNRAEQVSLL